jgi:hypothetical protein
MGDSEASRGARSAGDVVESNVEAMRTVIAAWNRGDMDAVGDAYAPDATVTPAQSCPDSAIRRGRDALITLYVEMRAAFPRAATCAWRGDGSASESLRSRRVLARPVLEYLGVGTGGTSHPLPQRQPSEHEVELVERGGRVIHARLRCVSRAFADTMRAED